MIDDLTALRLQLDWGVDEALGDLPIDRFTTIAPRPAAPAVIVPAMASAVIVPAMASAVIVPATASAVIVPPAEAADTLEALHAALDRFTGCPLRATATHTVRPAGSPSAPVVLIADAPGNDDDRSGLAFSGPAGAMLDRVMQTAGLTREHMLLTTLVPWRPPGNRPASEGEIQACLPFLHRLLALVRPRAVVLVGAGPVAALTGQRGAIRTLRGRWLPLSIPGLQVELTALPVLPLAQWLRDATTKQQLWSDLLRLQELVTTA